MRLSDFEAMVVRMAGEVPREFLDGIGEIVVSPRTLAHPERPGIYTLGECIPLPAGTGAAFACIWNRDRGEINAVARWREWTTPLPRPGRLQESCPRVPR